MEEGILGKTCRTCLYTGSNTVSLTKLTPYSTPKGTYADILKDIARLKFSDDQPSNMPQQLCSTCCRKLQKAYVFVKQARESEDRLLKMLNTPSEAETNLLHMPVEAELGVKKESDDDSNDEPALDQISTVSGDAGFDTLSLKPVFMEITMNNEKHLAEMEDTLEQMNQKSYGGLEINNENQKHEIVSPPKPSFLEITLEGANSEDEMKNDDILHNDIKDNLQLNNSYDELELKPEQELSEDHEESPQYKCDYCSRQYSDKSNLRYHLIYKHQIDYKSINAKTRTQHSRKKTAIKCRSCEYTANTHAALHYHTRAKHGSEEDKFKCKFCPYTNLKKFVLLSHMKKFHLSKIKLLKRNKSERNETEEPLTTTELNSSTEGNNCTEGIKLENGPKIENLTEANSSDCSSGDEEVIRDILNIKKRGARSKNSDCDELNETLETSKSTTSLQESNDDSSPEQEDILNTKRKKHLFICDQCPRRYTDRNRFKSHLGDKHGIDYKDFMKKQHKLSLESKVIKCHLCDYTANTPAAANFHMRSKHGTEEDKFKCNFCSYSNFKKFSLLKHMKKTHLAVIKMLKTQKASGNESTEDLVNLIPKYQDSKEAENNNPDECSDACSSGDEEFIRDIINMKKRGGKANITKSFAIRCDECGNVYKDSQALSVHKRNVHGEHKYKPCPQCHRKYKRNYDLKVHILHAHTPNYVDPKQPPKIREKRFMCTECSYICATSTLLTIHTNRHHTGEKPHKCNICSKSFVVAFDLKTHSYLHTGERPFKCPICSKGFRDRSHMLKHKRIHSEIKPYNCTECGKGFTKNYNLTIHKRTHMKGQKLNCSVCGKFFKDRAQLSIHQISESHHGEAV